MHLIEEINQIKRSTARTAYINGHIRNTAKLEGITHQCHWSRVNYHIIILLTQLSEQLIQTLTLQQLIWIRWNNTSRQDIQIAKLRTDN